MQTPRKFINSFVKRIGGFIRYIVRHLTPNRKARRRMAVLFRVPARTGSASYSGWWYRWQRVEREANHAAA